MFDLRQSAKTRKGGTKSDYLFKDAGEISAYAKNALAWANQKGIINGKGGSLLDPKGKATRDEIAQIMQNFIQKSGVIK